MWTAVALAGLASYLMRAVPMFALRDVDLPPRVSRALQHAAMGAMAVMLVTGARHLVDPGTPWTSGAVVRAVGVVGGVAAALVLGRRGTSMPVTVAVGVAVFAAALAAASLTA